MRRSLVLLLCSVLAQAVLFVSATHADVATSAPLDFDVPSGRFFTQTNGSPLGTTPGGYSVTGDNGIPFWDAFQRFGGPHVVGYPVTGRFMHDGFVTQAMQKAVFQWRPERGEVWFLNTFEALHDKGMDDWLLVHRQTPKPFDTSPDDGLPWDRVVARHLAFLEQNQAIKARYLSDPAWLDRFGLPVAYGDIGNCFVIRAQRAVFQYWKEDVPWARRGDVTVANGGDLAKEAGLWPAEAVALSLPDGRPVQLPSAAPPAAHQFASRPLLQPSAPQPAPTPTPVPAFAPRPGVYQAGSPEYGMNMFVFAYPSTTARDLTKVTNLGFGWQKSLFQWRQIEGAGKGRFDWYNADGVVYATAGSGVRLIVRVDFAPQWARADNSSNGPPDYAQDYGDFIHALVSRYSSSNPYGRIHAIEVWNEPNLAREWGGRKPDAAAYVRLLKAAYEGAKRADPSVVVISAGLSPTGTNNDEAVPDDLFLQQMYDAGAREYFDVLGAHAPGYKAPPEVSPAEAAANPAYGGHRVFTFRRTEDLRDVMVRNGDGNKQIWLTEFGWTSDTIHSAYSWFAVTEEQKADYLVRAFQWARNNWSPWIGVMALWTLPAPDWPSAREEYWWAVADPSGKTRPAYDRLLRARQSGVLP